MSKYIPNTNDILCLPTGYVAAITYMDKTIYKGTVTEVNTLQGTVTLKNGTMFTYVNDEYEKRNFDYVTVGNNNVVVCFSSSPLWDIIA